MRGTFPVHISPSRLTLLKSVLSEDDGTDELIKQVESLGSIPRNSTSVPPDTIRKAVLTNDLGDVFGDYAPIVRDLTLKPEISNMRDVAFHLDTEAVEGLVQKMQVDGGPQLDRKDITSRLFQRESAAVIQRMVESNQIKLAPETRKGVSEFLNQNRDFDFRTTSILSVKEKLDMAILEPMATIQKVQALTFQPEHVPPLLNSGVTSAYRVAQMNRSMFVEMFKNQIDSVSAGDVHDHAMRISLRNESALVQMHNIVKGTGLRAIDGPDTLGNRTTAFKQLADANKYNVNLENLFGSMDSCSCEDCASVFSPANYYVELLQFLRNNVLDPSVDANDNPIFPNTSVSGYKNTALSVLLQRRPDLQHIRLTCENTNTLLPYIDLANEVMESFLAHQVTSTPWTPDAQFMVDAFNVEEETSNQLLSEPQHTNYVAYGELLRGVCPIGTLPFHQPLTAMRIYLQFLKTSRAELMETFYKSPSPLENDKLKKVYREAKERALSAEQLNIIPQEYAIITRESIFSKEFQEVTRKTEITDEEYQESIGLRSAHEYWGYNSESGLLSVNGESKIGLRHLKKQFLPRAGITYDQAVKLMETSYVNLVYNSDQNSQAIRVLRSNYRLLQSWVDEAATDSNQKYKLLVDWLFAVCTLPSSAQQATEQLFVFSRLLDYKAWTTIVHDWFGRMDKLVVLAVAPELAAPLSVPPTRRTLPVKGRLYIWWSADNKKGLPNKDGYFRFDWPAIQKFGDLREDGSITAPDFNTSVPVETEEYYILGHIAANSVAYLDQNNDWWDYFFPEAKDNAALLLTEPWPNDDEFIREHDEIRMRPDGTFYYVHVPMSGSDITDWPARKCVAFIHQSDRLLRYWPQPEFREGKIVKWIDVPDPPPPDLPFIDPCDIESVKILHLDGSELDVKEWDRLQQFIRLSLRTGFSIEETDMAIASLSSQSTSTSQQDENAALFAPLVITPSFLNQLATIKRLQNTTGVDLPKLLALFSDMGTAGRALYQRLFSARNLIGSGNIFVPDAGGRILVSEGKIMDHLPALLAAFNIGRLQLEPILAQPSFNLKDEHSYLTLAEADLSLPNVTLIYRYTLLAEILRVQPQDLIGVGQLYSYSFRFATVTDAFNLILDFRQITTSFTTLQLISIFDHKETNTSFSPETSEVLRTVSTISDGLAALESKYLVPNHSPTAEDVKRILNLVYPVDLAMQVAAFLDGTATYSTDLDVEARFTVPEDLRDRIGFSDTERVNPENGMRYARFRVKGILSARDIERLGLVATVSSVKEALDRVWEQAAEFFSTHIGPLLEDGEPAKKVLLKADTKDTVGDKITYLYQHILRRTLGEKLVTETIAKIAEFEPLETVKLLLKKIFRVEAPFNSSQAAGPTDESSRPSVSALQCLLNLKEYGAQESEFWILLPPMTDVYTIARVGQHQPPPLKINGVRRPFVRQELDPVHKWFTEPIELEGGHLYRLDITGHLTPHLEWCTSRSPLLAVPSANLISEQVLLKVKSVLAKVLRASTCIKGLGLSLEELDYFHSASGKAGFGFDLNNPTFEGFHRVRDYCNFRSSVSPGDLSLIDFLKWITLTETESETPGSSSTPDVTLLAGKIAAATHWTTQDVEKIIGTEGFCLLRAADFSDMKSLIRVQSALEISRKVAIDIPLLFKCGSGAIEFDEVRKIVDNIRLSIRSRYTPEEWEQACKPLHNELRSAQRNALVASLLVHPSLADYNIIDAESLFEFFLIDVQMGACLQTSRIKQAISSVQQFVQRCILGLEEQRYPTVSNTSIDQERWKWMSKQSLWTANRKVFVHPESYIEPTLRDDKTDLYETMESELRQKDLSPESAQDCLKNYVTSLDQRANLIVQGIYHDDIGHTMHFVGRTRSSPFLFFHRTYSVIERYWTPWKLKAVPVDIPTYTTDELKLEAGTFHNPTSSSVRLPASVGSYVTPILVGKRLFIIFGIVLPQTTRQFSPSTFTLPKTSQSLENAQLHPYWEIRIGWTELHNGIWSPKQISSFAITEPVNDSEATPLDMYQFVPYRKKDRTSIIVFDAYGSAFGGFDFVANSFPTQTPQNEFDGLWYGIEYRTSFHFLRSDRIDWTRKFPGTFDAICSLQDRGISPEHPEYGIFGRPYVRYYTEDFSTLTTAGGGDYFFHHFSHDLMQAVNETGSLSPFFTRLNTYLLPSWSLEPISQTWEESYDELAGTYSLYNWEMGFHAPLQLADTFSKSQNFEAALDFCHHVFNPYVKGSGLAKRAWKWKPFSDVNTTSLTQALFDTLNPNTPDALTGPITMWRNKPFAPHVVARARPLAYMKWTVMRYLEILIQYGDWYFRQGTLETLPQALQLYVLAKHIYGPSPQVIPELAKRKPETYFSLLDRWDAFSNASVELELAFPLSNQARLLDEPEPDGKGIALTNIFGYARAHYFSIPNNTQLQGIFELIEQRIYNIRNCLDINGKTIAYPLWDPPINPAVLVSAISQGQSLSAVLNDLNSPMPNYRFSYLLQKAFALCADLKASSNMFLSIKEKRDSEALSNLRSRQELTVQNLTMELRKLQLEEAKKSIVALRQSRSLPLSRYRYYCSLAGKKPEDLAETDTEYKEIEMHIPSPSLGGDIVLTMEEQLELNESRNAKQQNDTVASIEILARFWSSLPALIFNSEPLGLGLSLSYGTQNFAQMAEGDARTHRSKAETHGYNATEAGKKAGYIRQHQERIHQANSAGHELMQINKQILAQAERVRIGEQEITTQQKSIDNAKETLDFLTSKYSNEELYTYLENSVRSTFYQIYTLAYDLAKKAEATYVFERGPQAAQTPFIKFGYWDPKRDGLESGELLQISLKQLELAYLERRAHDYEISKTVSLRQVAPMSLVQLRTNGTCEFNLPEVLFDIDFPGHYMRRIKCVSVSVPCIVGPYTGVNATLTLLNHSYRVDAAGSVDATRSVDNTAIYVQPPEGNPLFAFSNVPINCVAISSGQNDPGLFELSFASERYLPFEGAGVVSKWKFELPQALRSFDYGTIADVLLHLKYTSIDGGGALKAVAAKAVEQFVKGIGSLSETQGLFAVLDLQAEFPSEWARVASRVQPGTDLTMTLGRLEDHLPYYTRGNKPAAQNITFLTEMMLKADEISIETSGKTLRFYEASNAGLRGMQVFKSDLQLDLSMVDSVDSVWKLTVAGNGQNLELKKIFLVFQFTLSK